jgi:hypothetical protein
MNSYITINSMFFGPKLHGKLKRGKSAGSRGHEHDMTMCIGQPCLRFLCTPSVTVEQHVSNTDLELLRCLCNLGLQMSMMSVVYNRLCIKTLIAAHA